MQAQAPTSPSVFAASPLAADLYPPQGTSVFKRLRLAIKALRVLEKRQDDTTASRLLNASLDGDVFRRHAHSLAQTSAGSALLRERPTLHQHNVDLTALSKLPEDTVGWALARYYADNKIQPFESLYEVQDDGDYLIKWYRETHDLHHIVTAYGTDPISEMEVQAFALGNLGLRTSLLILTMVALLRPMGMPPVWRYFRRLKVAYRRGKQSANLFDVRYETYLEEKVETLRAALRVPSLDAA